MSLVKRSAEAGHHDGSFSYRGYTVGPLVPGNPRSAVMVNHPTSANGYATEEMQFESWRAAREWIDLQAEYEEEGKNGE
jgi:hypothetical protein